MLNWEYILKVCRHKLVINM